MTISEYRRAIHSSIRGLWSGDLSYFSFLDSMVSSIQRNFTRAWNDGIKSCGISVGDMTEEEQIALQDLINSEFLYISGFADQIEQRSKRNGGKLSPLLERGEMWVGKYEQVKSLAMTMACADRKLKWVMNPAKEHCSSCSRLNGRVYRASIWRKYDLHPRKFTLACRGFRCGCVFEQTVEPVTPGRPPAV